MDIFGHKVSPKYNGVAGGAAVPPYTPPTDVYLQDTVAGGGADNRVNLANWLGLSQFTSALNATDYAGTPNGSNTCTATAGNSSKEATSGLINGAGCQTFGGAFKAGSGMGAVALFSGVNNTDYSLFNLSTGAVTDAGTAVGTANALGGGWYWCSVTFAAPLANFGTVKFTCAPTTAEAIPTVAWNAAGTETLFAGPFAGT